MSPVLSDVVTSVFTAFDKPAALMSLQGIKLSPSTIKANTKAQIFIDAKIGQFKIVQNDPFIVDRLFDQHHCEAISATLNEYLHRRHVLNCIDSIHNPGEP